MTIPVYHDTARRHDFVLLFDVSDGNPNGDPDAGNLPRIDPETMQGLVTDVAIKRKVRDWVHALKGDEARYKIYVLGDGEALNSKHQRAYTALNMESLGKKQPPGDINRARAWMCENFFDVRTFGAVMTTGVNAGQVRGPVQLTFARSIDQITPLDVSITRVAVTKPEDAEISIADDGTAKGKTTEMGRKAIVPYGLYRVSGFFNPHFAKQTGFNNDDLALVWQALMLMWDFDRSAARGLMTCRGLYIFSHTSPLGDAPAHQLLERVNIKRCEGVAVPRTFGDYEVSVNTAGLPATVTIETLLG
ncbi:MAG: type I-C CRISPR-associated protein Cas7/Csd2 [Anaerolinea sp.]|nr:type I-C CRISPR-associated protein Cas7/Csd2 [Anaerolinea sp.]